VDGLAYVPEPREDFWPSLRTTIEDELGRYDTVIHLRTPAVDHGYNRSNQLRTESAAAASAIDARILEAWAKHPDGSWSSPRMRFSTRPHRPWRSSEANCQTVVPTTPTLTGMTASVPTAAFACPERSSGPLE